MTTNANESNRIVRACAKGARVTSQWGAGRLVYICSDGWAGVQLDGERRVDEYPMSAMTMTSALEAQQFDAVQRRAVEIATYCGVCRSHGCGHQ